MLNSNKLLTTIFLSLMILGTYSISSTNSIKKSSSKLISIESIEEALSFNEQDLSLTCPDLKIAKTRLSFFLDLLLKKEQLSIEIDDLLGVLEKIKQIFIKMQETLPLYSDPLVLLQMNLLNNNMNIIINSPIKSMISKSKLQKLQAQLEKYESKYLNKEEKIGLINQIITLINEIMNDLNNLKGQSNITWKDELSRKIEIITTRFNDKCTTCNINCEECDSIDIFICKKCKDGFDLEETGDCIPKKVCPLNQYVDLRQCKDCDTACNGCKGPSNKDCIDCNQPKYFNKDGECILFECDSNCATCGLGRCDNCKDGFQFDENFNCIEIIECEINQYLEGRICLNCDIACDGCEGPSNSECINCKTPEYRNKNGICVTSECDLANCLYCDENDLCSQCKVDYELDENGNCIKPRKDCLSQQYSEGGECKTCDISCDECTGSTNGDCKKCKLGFKEEAGKCIPATNECSIANCLECEGNICKKCREGNHFDNNNYCVPNENCNSQFYNHVEIATADCLTDCDCDGTRRCDENKKCRDCNQLSKLNPNLYPPEKCEGSCHENCVECKGPNKNQCTTCPNKFYLYNNECLECDYSCKSCFGGTNKDCLECDKGYIKNLNNECVLADCKIDNCADCNADGTCKKCYEEFYLLKDECKECDCSCKSCFGDSNKDCYECDEDYKMNLDNICIINNCSSNCFECKDGDKCNQCEEGFELDENYKCIKKKIECRGINCKSCDDKGLCKECEQGYDLDNNLNCVKKIVCGDNCLICENENVCKECDKGFFKENDQCKNCISSQYIFDETTNKLGEGRCLNNCECDGTRVCDPSGKCGDCNFLSNLLPNKYSKENCEGPCHENCNGCRGPLISDCTGCKSNMFLSGGFCDKCDDACDICKGPTSKDCVRCSSGYKNINGVCSKFICPENCLTCDNNSNKCDVCLSGFVLTEDFLCKPKPKCISDCQLCKNENECVVCNEGFMLTNDLKCIKKEEIICVNNCDKCSDTDACEICKSGYFLGDDLTCKNCISSEFSFQESGKCNNNCECDGTRVCDPSGRCADCNFLSNLLPNKYSKENCEGPCHENCNGCRGPLISDCTGCKNNMFLSDGFCEKCDDACDICKGPTSKDCVRCSSGYKNINGVCSKFICPENCLTCDNNSNKCDVCLSGFVLTEDFLCKPKPKCISDCQLCKNENECVVCNEGFMLTNDLKCIKKEEIICINNCDKCNNTNECEVCKAGYFLGEDLTCKNCISSEFSFQESGKCNNNCECDGTRVCDPSGKCGDCNFLSNLLPNKYSKENCEGPCHENCNGCRGPLISDCTGCKNNMFLSDGFCDKCDDACDICKGPTSKDCVRCSSGYKNINGVCSKFICPENCLTCDNNPDKCDLCLSGFVLTEDFLCKLKPKCVAKNCEQCEPENEMNCKECNKGFFLGEDKQCNTCESSNYLFKETGNCNNNCECDGTRVCAPNKKCGDCNFYSNLLPTQYSKSSCEGPCHESCKGGCRGPLNNECSGCNSSSYLNNGLCTPCDKSCSTCKGPSANNCNSCASGYKLINGTCTSIACPENCISCKNTNQCDICKPGFELNNNLLCSPKIICHSTCKQCSGVSALECSECKTGFILTPSPIGQCVPEIICESGYHRVDQECVKNIECNNGCQTCDKIPSNCTSCGLNSFLKDNKCCHNTCEDCSGPKANQCLKCADEINNIFKDGECLPRPKCENKYNYVYDENLNALGQNKCSNNCECAGSRLCSPYGFCHECLYLVENFPSLFKIEDCSICHKSCKTCNGPSQYNCTSCPLGEELSNDGTCQLKNSCSNKFTYKLDESKNILGPNKCENDCSCSGSRRCSPSGYCHECLYLVQNYPSQFKINDCALCDPACLNCTGPAKNQCSSCKSGFSFNDGYCVNETCSEKCLHCSNDNNCTSCLPGYLVHDNKCCDSSCQDCSTPDICTKCKAEEQLVNGKCIKCDLSCLTCNELGPKNCTSCGNGRALKDGECLKCDISCSTCLGPSFLECLSCPLNKKFQNGICCDLSCSTCNGPEKTQCTSCKPGEALTANGRCVPCDSSCDTCSGPSENECLSCKSELKLSSQNRCCHPSCETCSGITDNDCRTCVAPLILDQNSACVACHSNCEKCHGSAFDECSVCKTPFVLDNNKCCDSSCKSCSGPTKDECTSCPLQSYLNGRICSPCNTECSSCTGLTRLECTLCPAGLKLTIDHACCDPSCNTCSGPLSNQCTSCKNGEYFLNGVCTKCDSKCNTCSGPSSTDCITCIAPLEIRNGSCCHSSCETCQGQLNNECLTCTLPAQLAQGKCIVCDSTCKTCFGPKENQCLTCNENNILKNNKCIKQVFCDANCLECDTKIGMCAICKPGFTTVSGTCVKCDSSCKECNATDSNSCTSCDAKKRLWQGKCCHESCLTCSSPDSNKCLSCAFGRLFIDQGICYQAGDSNSRYVAYDDPTVELNIRDPLVKIGIQDYAIGVWTRFLNYIPKKIEWNGEHLLFKLSTLTDEEEKTKTNSFKESTLAVYLTPTNYIFETFKMNSDNNAEIIRKNVSINRNEDELENSWNLLFIYYSAETKTAKGYVIFGNQRKITVDLSSKHNHPIANSLKGLFFQNSQGINKGFNGQIYKPNIIYGTKFTKNLFETLEDFNNNLETYFKFNLNPILNSNKWRDTSIKELDSNYLSTTNLPKEIIEAQRYSIGGWFKFNYLNPNLVQNIDNELNLFSLFFDSIDEKSVNTDLIPPIFQVSFDLKEFSVKLQAINANNEKFITQKNLEGLWSFENIWFYVALDYDYHSQTLTKIIRSKTINVNEKTTKIVCFVPKTSKIVFGKFDKLISLNGYQSDLYANWNSNFEFDYEKDYGNLINKIPKKQFKNISVLSETYQVSGLLNSFNYDLSSEGQGYEEYGLYIAFKPNINEQNIFSLFNLTMKVGLENVEIFSLSIGEKKIIIKSYGLKDKLLDVVDLEFSQNSKYNLFWISYSLEKSEISYAFKFKNQFIKKTIHFHYHYLTGNSILFSTFGSDKCNYSTCDFDAEIYKINVLFGSGSHLDNLEDVFKNEEQRINEDLKEANVQSVKFTKNNVV